MTEEQKELPKTEAPHDYFPGASFVGKLFNINGVVWLVRAPHIITSDDSSELGWDANNMAMNAAYHMFTESEIKEQNLVIQEF